MPGLWYSLYDFGRKIFSLNTENSTEEHKVIDEKIREFLCKMQHSIAIGNEGIMRDYVEDIKERMNNEKNSDIRELYRIVKEASRWAMTTKEETLEDFLKVTHKRIIESGQIKIQGEKEKERQGRIEAEQRAELVQNTSSIFTRKILKFDNEELRDVVVDNQGTIVEEVVKQVMENNLNQEQVLNAIMEEVKRNKNLILSAKDSVKAISEAIESGIRSFENPGPSTSLGNINMQGVSGGVSR